MKDYKEVFVGQVFTDRSNGEPDIKVLEIGKGLADKYPDLCYSGAQHGLDEGIDVRYSTDGQDESIADYIDFLERCDECFHKWMTMPEDERPKLGVPFVPIYNGDK